MFVILIVDDEPLQRDILKTILDSEGYETHTAASGKEALEIIRKYHPDVMLIDLKMEGMDGIELMDSVPHEPFEPSMIIMTAHGTISSTVRAMKKGAFDYLTKPLEKDSLLVTIKRATDRVMLLKENLRLQREIQGQFRIEGIIGKTPGMERAIGIVKKVAPSTVTVLLKGESGTGKELIAKAIHYNSARKSRAFNALNCAAIPETLFESELFGYEPGAFTGAVSRKEGMFEMTDGGTLFLDEIGDLPLSMQSKLLRVIQEKEIRRVGGKETVGVDVRVIVATNKDLIAEIGRGGFREDLYYRLAVVTIELPPLRDRLADLTELVNYFIDKFNAEYGKRVKGVEPAVMKAFMGYGWPGNIRQLGSVLERAVLLSDKGQLTVKDIEGELRAVQGRDLGMIEIPEEGLDFEELERDLIGKAMAKAGGVATKAAKLLGMSYKTFLYRLEKHGPGAADSQSKL